MKKRTLSQIPSKDFLLSMALQGSTVANFKAKHKLDVSSQSRKHSRKETRGTAKVVRRKQKTVL